MTTALPRTTLRALIWACLALTLTFASFTATTARAASQRDSYVATLGTPLDAPRAEILDGVLWRCAGDTCRGARDGERPRITCARVVRKFGPVTRFSSGKGDLPPKELARCNGVK